MTTTFLFERVHYMPKELRPGVLYVAEKFGVAGHLCACGCGQKVITPLGPTEWSFEDSTEGPTLRPSIGNWQLPCKSHYWITVGKVEWSRAWSAAQIEGGRRSEEERRRAYFESRRPPRHAIVPAIRRWFQRLRSR